MSQQLSVDRLGVASALGTHLDSFPSTCSLEYASQLLTSEASTAQNISRKYVLQHRYCIKIGRTRGKMLGRFNHSGTRGITSFNCFECLVFDLQVVTLASHLSCIALLPLLSFNAFHMCDRNTRSYTTYPSHASQSPSRAFIHGNYRGPRSSRPCNTSAHTLYEI